MEGEEEEEEEEKEFITNPLFITNSVLLIEHGPIYGRTSTADGT